MELQNFYNSTSYSFIIAHICKNVNSKINSGVRFLERAGCSVIMTERVGNCKNGEEWSFPQGCGKIYPCKMA